MRLESTLIEVLILKGVTAPFCWLVGYYDLGVSLTQPERACLAWFYPEILYHMNYLRVKRKVSIANRRLAFPMRP